MKCRLAPLFLFFGFLRDLEIERGIVGIDNFPTGQYYKSDVIFNYLCDNSNQPKFWADSNAPQFVLANALRASEVARLIVQPPRRMRMQ